MRQEIANEIQARTGIDSRATILGHVQRGGSPTLRDRVNASAMGYHAVCLLEQGKYNRIVGMKGEKLVDYPVDEALEMTKTLDPVLWTCATPFLSDIYKVNTMELFSRGIGETALFYGIERRSVLTFSIADLTEKASCNCWKSNERCSENKTVVCVKIARINKEYLF